MQYCKLHPDKSYTEEEYNNLKNVCGYSGCYKDVADGKIRIYCFHSIDNAVDNTSHSRLCELGK